MITEIGLVASTLSTGGRIRKNPVLAMALLLALLCSSLSAEEKKEAATPTMPQMEMGAPKELKKMHWQLGNWKAQMKHKMDPSGPWMEETGSGKIFLSLDSCVIQSEFSNPMMGMSMKGMGMLTYSRDMKKYQSYWVDNIFGSPSFYECDLDSAGNMTCEGLDRMMGMTYHGRTVAKQVNANSWTFEYFMSMDGKMWDKSMEMTLTRQ